jgi:hypothetical protein
MTGAVESGGLALALADCAYPNVSDEITLVRLEYQLTAFGGTLELVDHATAGRALTDCSSNAEEWCVRTDPSGNIGVWMIPPAGDCEAIGIDGEVMVERLTVQGNFPNPFNPITTIAYDLPSSAIVTLSVHNLTGQCVRTLVDAAAVGPGHHQVVWDGRADDGGRVASGVYFYRLEADGEAIVRKMVMVK